MKPFLTKFDDAVQRALLCVTQFASSSPPVDLATLTVHLGQNRADDSDGCIMTTESPATASSSSPRPLLSPLQHDGDSIAQFTDQVADNAMNDVFINLQDSVVALRRELIKKTSDLHSFRSNVAIRSAMSSLYVSTCLSWNHGALAEAEPSYSSSSSQPQHCHHHPHHALVLASMKSRIRMAIAEAACFAAECIFDRGASCIAPVSSSSSDTSHAPHDSHCFVQLLRKTGKSQAPFPSSHSQYFSRVLQCHVMCLAILNQLPAIPPELAGAAAGTLLHFDVQAASLEWWGRSMCLVELISVELCHLPATILSYEGSAALCTLRAAVSCQSHRSTSRALLSLTSTGDEGVSNEGSDAVGCDSIQMQQLEQLVADSADTIMQFVDRFQGTCDEAFHTICTSVLSSFLNLSVDGITRCRPSDSQLEPLNNVIESLQWAYNWTANVLDSADSAASARSKAVISLMHLLSDFAVNIEEHLHRADPFGKPQKHACRFVSIQSMLRVASWTYDADVSRGSSSSMECASLVRTLLDRYTTSTLTESQHRVPLDSDWSSDERRWLGSAVMLGLIAEGSRDDGAEQRSFLQWINDLFVFFNAPHTDDVSNSLQLGDILVTDEDVWIWHDVASQRTSNVASIALETISVQPALESVPDSVRATVDFAWRDFLLGAVWKTNVCYHPRDEDLIQKVSVVLSALRTQVSLFEGDTAIQDVDDAQESLKRFRCAARKYIEWMMDLLWGEPCVEALGIESSPPLHSASNGGLLPLFHISDAINSTSAPTVTATAASPTSRPSLLTLPTSMLFIARDMLQLLTECAGCSVFMTSDELATCFLWLGKVLAVLALRSAPDFNDVPPNWTSAHDALLKAKQLDSKRLEIAFALYELQEVAFDLRMKQETPHTDASSRECKGSGSPTYHHSLVECFADLAQCEPTPHAVDVMEYVASRRLSRFTADTNGAPHGCRVTNDMLQVCVSNRLELLHAAAVDPVITLIQHDHNPQQCPNVLDWDCSNNSGDGSGTPRWKAAGVVPQDGLALRLLETFVLDQARRVSSSPPPDLEKELHPPNTLPSDAVVLMKAMLTVFASVNPPDVPECTVNKWVSAALLFSNLWIANGTARAMESAASNDEADTVQQAEIGVYLCRAAIQWMETAAGPSRKRPRSDDDASTDPLSSTIECNMVLLSADLHSAALRGTILITMRAWQRDLSGVPLDPHKGVRCTKACRDPLSAALQAARSAYCRFQSANLPAGHSQAASSAKQHFISLIASAAVMVAYWDVVVHASAGGRADPHATKSVGCLEKALGTSLCDMILHAKNGDVVRDVIAALRINHSCPLWMRFCVTEFLKRVRDMCQNGASQRTVLSKDEADEGVVKCAERMLNAFCRCLSSSQSRPTQLAMFYVLFQLSGTVKPLLPPATGDEMEKQATSFVFTHPTGDVVLTGCALSAARGAAALIQEVCPNSSERGRYYFPDAVFWTSVRQWCLTSTTCRCAVEVAIAEAWSHVCYFAPMRRDAENGDARMAFQAWLLISTHLLQCLPMDYSTVRVALERQVAALGE